MSNGTISGFYSTTVVLGTGNYGPTLTVASGGFINPNGYGATGIYADAAIANAQISNYGTVWGSYGGEAGFTSVPGAGGPNGNGYYGGTGISLVGGNI
jgi:hypothetical protein